MNDHSVNDRPAGAPSSPRSRGRPRVDDKRRRILDAALRVFAERGFHGTAVPLVADAAGVGTGTLYRYFTSKEQLVNEVFRDAKTRLGATLLGDLDAALAPASLFLELWRRLARFARAEPLAFQFLEMQDHAPYLDAESRKTELEVLGPIWMAGQALREQRLTRDLPIEILIALVWGALVGLLKAERLGYFALSDDMIERAGEACWDAVRARQTSPSKSKRRKV